MKSRSELLHELPGGTPPNNQYWSRVGLIVALPLSLTSSRIISSASMLDFLAVQNSSIGDLVTDSVTQSLSDFLILTLQSDHRDL